MVNVSAATHTRVMQTLFVASGCDYISFFNGIGKATFLKYFFQYSDFITGYSQYTSGSLSDTVMDNGIYKQGFLAFIRLIGTVYFKKHANAFESLSPVAHYKKFVNPETDVEIQHKNWLDDIRQNIWDRITFETEMIPSIEALWRHWKRCCWVLDMWRQADSNAMHLADLASWGWKVENELLSIDWDSDDNQSLVRERVQLLTKGCKCKSGCATGRCGCRRKGKHCAEGCSCLHCSNLPGCKQGEEFTEDEIQDDQDTELSETHTLFTSFLDSLSEDDSISDCERSEEENIDLDTLF